MAWWADLLRQGVLGAAAALWIAGVVIPLVTLGLIELLSLASASVRSFAVTSRTRTARQG